ncbi:MAG TPA: hypothetical protein VMJ74_14425, partial [Pseudomonadales bacterium]|nr:hypothetical protein [Pseudomonadales bacterium]
LFNDGDDYQATIRNPYILGYMRPDLRMQYLVTSRGVIGMDTQHVIFHEYVHYLLRNGGTTALHPKWYDEGLAEMLAATRLHRDTNKVVLGGDIASRIDDLRAGIYVPLSKVIAATDLSDWNPNHVAIFYSKSFALVNYLHLSRIVGKDHIAQMNEYLRLFREGTDSSVAFEQAFGMPPAMMEKELGEFLSQARRPVLSLPMDLFPSDSTYTRREMPKAETAYRIGYTMVPDNPQVARKLFQFDQLDRSDGRYRAALGVTYQREKDYARALDQMKAALDMAPDEPVVLQESADVRAVWCRVPQRPTNCEDLRETARVQYLKLLSIEPDRIEADAALGTLLEELGEPTDATVHLERAYAAAPWYVPIIAELGVARASAGQSAEAIPLLKRALAWVESDAALAQRIRAALERAEVSANSAHSESPADRVPDTP